VLAFPQIFLVGYFEIGNFDLKAFLIFLLLVLLSGIIQLIHEIGDIKEDALAGVITSAVFYGKKIINHICMILDILSIGISISLYMLKMVHTAAFLALLIFQIYILREIFFKGITNKTRLRFRVFGLLSGIMWIISIFL
jgi:4-hydroxybenzoate polyprenyltransferase